MVLFYFKYEFKWLKYNAICYLLLIGTVNMQEKLVSPDN